MSKLLKTGTILLVSSQTSHRSGLRKTLCDMGADNRLIEVAPDFRQAKERLEKGPVNIIITDDEIGGKDRGLNFIGLHEANNPISKSRIFILMTGETTPFLMADFAFRGGDSIVTKPFNNETFIKALNALLVERDKISAEDGLVHDIQDAIVAGNLEQADALIATFTNPTCSQALYAKALVYDAKNKDDLAYDLYLKTLDQKINFKALVSILRVGSVAKKHHELLRFVEIWLKDFPIHHSSLPDMTRVIVTNKKYELLDELFDLLAQHKMEDDFAKLPMAAGFVMAAVNHLELGEMEKAKRYALKGVEYSCHRYQIIARAIEVLVKAGFPADAEDAYENMQFELSSKESKMLDLKLREMVFPRQRIYIDCQRLLAEKIVDADLFHIMIKSMKELGKDPQSVIKIATQNFPDKIFS